MGDGELGPAGPHAPRLGAAQGLDVLEQGALGQLLEGEGLLGSFALAVLVPNRAGSAQGPRALELGHLLEGEAAEAP